MDTRHNRLRDRIIREYFTLPKLKCLFCRLTYPVPKDDVARVVAEHKLNGFRPDVAALNVGGHPLAVIEVVDTNEPSHRVLEAQSALPAAFYVMMDALDSRFTGYCSPFCWTNRKQENVSSWTVPACSYCERPYHTLEFTYELLDWESPEWPSCIECAARMGGQFRSPSELALGDPDDRIPSLDAKVLDLFLSFSDADFWAMVWTKRTSEPTKAQYPETETAARLNQVEAAFSMGDWNRGQKLLQPIGAPAWDRPPGPPLFAWEHNNCVRVAMAWRQLRAYRVSCLPVVIRRNVMSRPPMGAVQVEAGEIVIIHRGFPDGRYTACGIDRLKCADTNAATMTETPTCERCKQWG